MIRRRTIAWPLAAFVTAVVLACAACGPRTDATVAPGSEQIPGPGHFHIVGDPATATSSLSFRYVGGDGVPSQVGDDFATGQPVIVDRTTLPGPHGVMVNGILCTGSFVVEADLETDLIVHLNAGACEAKVERTHKVGEVTHLGPTSG